MEAPPNLAGGGDVERVPRLDGDHAGFQTASDQGQVAQQVQGFVPRQLIRKPEWSTGTALRKDDGVFEGAALTQARRADGGDPVFETEGARGGQLVQED